MTEQEMQHRNVAHAYLNALSAGFQGLFTATNVTQQLNPSAESEGQLRTLEPKLKWIGAQFARLKAQPALYFSGNFEPVPGEGSRLFELFDELRAENSRALPLWTSTFAELRSAPSAAKTALAVGAIARLAYSRNHFVQGLVWYGEAFGLEEVADRWRQQLLSCQQGIQEASYFFYKAKEGLLADPPFAATIWNAGAASPFVLRAQLNDMVAIEALRGVPAHPESYGLTPAQAAQWTAIGLALPEAAEWHGCDFTTTTAKPWFEAGIASAIIAVNWRLRDFAADRARPWIIAGFSASLAADCLRAGHADPDSARKYLAAARPG